MGKGKVYLVGTGPGDADLLTIKAEKLIKSADAIIYDRLGESGILSMAKNSAKLINLNAKEVGIMFQSEINKVLIETANEYENVVRLKFGDPFMFARGGEELQALKDNDISFEVVPGVTQISAVPAYAGIPVAHRKHTSSLNILANTNKSQTIDYKSVVSQNSTLVLLMYFNRLNEIMQGLIQNGLSAETPCAVIENGTRYNQRKFTAKVSEIYEKTKDENINDSAIILVGDVVSLSEDLDWFSNKPLKNIKILSTQRAKSASRFIPRLKENGAEISFCPIIQKTTTLPQSFDLDEYSVIAFSSMQCVESFFECLMAQHKDARSLFGKKIACIGSQTEKTAKARGIYPDFVPEVFSGKCMIEGMIDKGLLAQNDKLLLVRPQDGSEEVLEVLNKNNIKYDDTPFYKTDYS